jgi:hypothetical protein
MEENEGDGGVKRKSRRKERDGGKGKRKRAGGKEE